MKETKQEGTSEDNSSAIDERKSEATTDETLSDIEESDRDTSSGNSKRDGPSPDGALDESDEIKDAGPM